MKKELNVGLVGYGMGGRIFHAPLIDHVPGLKIRTIRETKEDKIRHARERYPGVHIVNDTSQILDDPEIDLVVLAIPNKFHHSLAKQALEHGKHVVVEKPFTVTSAEADELIELSKEKDSILSIYQNRRLDSDFLTVSKVIAGGKLGRLVEFEAHYDRFRNSIRPDTWKEEGTPGTGLLYDLGSHLIDQALVLFGVPEEVTGFISSQRDNSRIPDNFEVLLHYENIKVTLKSGMLVKAPLTKYILLGTHGAFVKHGEDVQESVLNAGEIPLSDPEWGREPAENWGTLVYEREGETIRESVESLPGNYPEFYRSVRDAILGTDKLMVKPEEARNTIRIIELVMQSAKEKRTVPFA